MFSYLFYFGLRLYNSILNLTIYKIILGVLRVEVEPGGC
jgi:hypothetical protein